MKYLALLPLLVACKDPYADDSPTDDSTVTTDDSSTDDSAADDSGAETQSIEGNWLSEGENVSELFQSDFFKYVSITASFNADGSYAVQATDDAGTQTDFSGTYVVDVGTTIPSIVLSQAVPTTATAEGIWQVEGSTLTYEVVQTSPNPYNFVAPTPETGFGSSSGPGLQAGVNVQIYVKQ